LIIDILVDYRDNTEVEANIQEENAVRQAIEELFDMKFPKEKSKNNSKNETNQSISSQKDVEN